MYIGDIYLPILSNIDKKSVSKITKEIAGINAKEPRTVSIRRNLQPITLEGYLYNDGEKDDEQYAEDVEALQYRSAGYCYTQYADLDGFIEIEGADAPETSEELGVRNYSVEGKYLPASKYERVVEVETEMRDNEFNIEFPPHVALPVGATNVRVKTSQDSVKLSAPAFMAGDIPIYRPFPVFYPDDVTHSDSDTPQYDATAYKLTYNLLDAKDESISYTFVSGVDVPLGSYRVVLRIKEDSVVTGDVKITVSDGTTNVVDSLHTLVGDGVWNIVKTASFSILQKGLTYTITVTKAEDDATNIAVNYGFLLPEKRARVAFDVAAEYDVGECKVFDTITTDSEESTWIQVFNPEHDFAGDIVVQNSMFRWVIKQTAWKDATKVYNISGSAPVEIGKLYNKAFGDDTVAIKFKEIKPNYLKFTFELDTGNATSESTSAKEIDTVEITPFNVVIDKDVIGAYKDHYTFESTPGVNVEYENGIIAGIDSNSVYGLIKSVNVTSSYDGDIIETTGSESSDSYVVPFVIPCEISSYLYKQAADLVISKDNGDVERKFFKDDFSVDSSDNYTGHDGTSKGFYTWDTANSKLVWQVASITANQANIYNLITAGQYGISSVSFKVAVHNEIDAQRIGLIVAKRGDNYVGAVIRRDNDGTNKFMIYMGSWEIKNTSGLPIAVDFFDGATYTITVETTSTGINGKVYREGVYVNGYTVPYAKFTNYTPPTPDEFVLGFGSHLRCAENITCEIYDLSFKPSESYADDFSTDTTERYQAVTGTVAYDDANKRMNVTTATGVNGKASGRLKSYKFCEGSQIYDVLLPTGADGDFICLATHSANGLMTDGIGVGLQSDGAGNWNLATLSGTTVTEGADSGLVDGKTARIEIEKDITGAYWYYIYDVSGTKPTTATGKLFTTLSEGYTGWYANGNSKTYAIDNISIRAESIVGRTNVEVTEPFWFRDEATVDALGRFPFSTTFTFDTDKYKTGTGNADFLLAPGKKMKAADTVVKFTYVRYTATTDSEYIGVALLSQNKGRLGDSQYYIYLRMWANATEIRLNPIYDTGSGSTTGSEKSVASGLTLGTGSEVEFQVSYDPATKIATITATVGGTDYTQTYEFSSIFTQDLSEYYPGIGYYRRATYTGYAGIKNIQISGTRVYQKPIHRGAMLETYHDGTQEVVGTTFIDDCQWDRSAEYNNSTGWVFDTVNGVLTISNAGDIYSTLDPVTSGIVHVQMFNSGSSASTRNMVLFKNGSEIYRLAVKSFSGGGITLYDASYSTIGNLSLPSEYDGVWIDLTVLFDIPTRTFKVWLDGRYIGQLLDTTTGYIASEYTIGFGGWGVDTHSFKDIQIIAASPVATNGIAACIPPIGGGARYGVEESVYNTFTTENVNKGVYLTTAKVKTTNPNADEVSLEYTNDTTSITLNTTPIDVDATYTVKTTPITIDANETDTLRVSVKNSTTYDQSANYVESLSLIPVSGDDVLYPQDLAFISGVKPSQKRKVEVK